MAFEGTTREMVAIAADHVRARTRLFPHVGLVLGSGLGALADRLTDEVVIPYGEIPHFPHTAVIGHAGRLVIGRLSGVPVLIMQGRAHYYEGYSIVETTMPIRVMQLLGVRTLVVTNAAGGLRGDMQPGNLMAITDHINMVGMSGHHPLRGPNDDSLGPRFPDMSRVYDPELLDLLRAQARDQGISLHEGVYVMVAGPSFETPAEVRFLRAMGADAVGMSTAAEVTVARHAGMRVLGVSLISNVAIDTVRSAHEEGTAHEEVLLAGQQAVPVLVALLEGFLKRLS